MLWYPNIRCKDHGELWNLYLLEVFLPNTDLLLWVELEIITEQITVANNHLAMELLTSFTQSVMHIEKYNN